VPLSEEEQRILQQIERQFYDHDRGLARTIESTTLTRQAARTCRWSAVGFGVGLVVLLLAFASSWILGVVGFCMMLASAVTFARALHRISRYGWEQLSAKARAHRSATTPESLAERLKRRFGGP
jgi:hypothetical protein